MHLSAYIAIILGILLVFSLRKITKWFRIVFYAWKLPRLPYVWPFGNTLPFVKAPYDDFSNLVFKYMLPTFKEFKVLPVFWAFHMPMVIITNYKSAEIFLKSVTEIRKASFYDLLRPWLGDGLLTSSGGKWTRRRKLLTPSFHFNILENFLPVFNEQSEILIEILDKKAGQTVDDIRPYITNCTLDIICATAMGKQIYAQKNSDSEYVKAIATLSDNLIQAFFKPWLTIPWIYYFSSIKRQNDKCLKILHGFTENVIAERQKEFANEKLIDKTKDENEFGIKRRKAFLDTLLETFDYSHEFMTVRDIREEVDTFMFEGHDTTSTALIWTIVFLMSNPLIQDKLHEELDEIFDSEERRVTMNDISRMKYLDAIIKEALRLSNTVPLFARSLIKDIEIDGYLIPSGIDVVFFPWIIHSDSKIYENPDEFIPERFLDQTEKQQQPPPFSFIPFSAGSRNCIGQKFALMEEKVILSYIFRRFRITGSPFRRPILENKLSPFIVSRPLNAIKFKLDRRAQYSNNHI